MAISPGRLALRGALGQAAKEAERAGVPLAQIAADLRQLAIIYDPAGRQASPSPEEGSK